MHERPLTRPPALADPDHVTALLRAPAGLDRLTLRLTLQDSNRAVGHLTARLARPFRHAQQRCLISPEHRHAAVSTRIFP